MERLDKEIKQAELNKSDTEYSLKNIVKTYYENLNLAQKNLVDSINIYETSKITFKYKETNYELGLISKNEMDNARLLFNQDQSRYNKAVNDYYLAARTVQLAECGVIK